jgi:sortase A
MPGAGWIGRRRTLYVAIGVAAVVGGLVIEATIGWFYVHSAVVGGQLLRQESHAIAGAHHEGRKPRHGASCSTSADPPGAPQGLLEAPTIGMRAPVLAGDGDTQLDVAVGHVPASAWPGQPGTSVLVAHDVTYFSDIGQLTPGSSVEYLTPCATYLYSVTGHEVITAGAPVYSDPARSVLVLETCYPPDALYFTDQRYLVTATYVSTSDSGERAAPVEAPATPTVPAPAALAAQGLTLVDNEEPMGVMTIDGTPTSTWRESAAPLDDDAAALAEYFGAIRSAEQEQPAWWSALAPTVPMTDAGPLIGSSIAGFTSALDVTLQVTSETLTEVTLSVGVAIVSGRAPGDYSLGVSVADESGTLAITRWSMTPD